MTSDSVAAARRVVVVGGGHAAAALVGLVRQEGHTGEIILVGDEIDPPYQRPPLSKKFTDRVFEHAIKPLDFYRNHDVELRLGEPVTGIDPAAGRAEMRSGAQLPYDVLVLATGARPRQLLAPGAHLEGVGTLRTLGDTRRLRKWIQEGRRLAIVGGGYVGLEVAAVAGTLGMSVTVLEREERLLARTASHELARFLADHHAAAGIDVRTGAAVAAIDGARGQARELILEDGSSVACESVLVGVGAIPNDELARDAGVECDGGIVVDDRARTNVDGILAIGDVTVRPVPGHAGVMRLESIPSATEQARQAAATILGLAPRSLEVPWFWSDQYQLKLKIAGVQQHSEVIVRGEPGSARFALIHHRSGLPVAVESVNCAAEFIAVRKWIGEKTILDPQLAQDPSVPLRDVMP